MLEITREQFKIDTIVPAVQTAASFLATQVLGRLGHYTVSAHSAVLLSLGSSLLASLANNFFENKIYQYLAIPVTVAGTIVANHFLFAGKELASITNAKTFAILTVALLAVKIAADNLYRLEWVKDSIVNAFKKAEEKGEAVATEAAKSTLTEVAKTAEKIEDEAEKIKLAAEKEEKKLEGKKP